MSERLRVGVLLAVSVLVYANTLTNGFALDDYLYIFGNPAVTRPSIKGLFTATKDFNVFRPVTFAALALNYVVGGAHAWGYHLVNLLLHVGVVLLLYVVLKELLEFTGQGTALAWVVALLFAVHPIHTEAVASIVGRSELLAVGFLLAAWIFHLRDQVVRSLLCFVLAMLAKESAIVFLPLVFAGDYLRDKLKPLLRYGWIAGISAFFMAVLWKAQGGRFGEKQVNFLDNPLANIPANLRILNALRVAWKYIGLHVYPATLSCDYSYDSITLYTNWRHTLPPAIAAGLVLSVWIWAIWTRRRDWALAGSVYLVGFAVTANVLVPTGTILGERLAYLPSAGFCLFVGLIWIRLERRQRRVAWTLLILIVMGLAGRTAVRNRDWRDNLTLFSAAVRAVPGSAKAHAGLAGEFMRASRLKEAEKEFQIALSIYPDFVEAMESYGIVQSALGHDQEAFRIMSEALSMTRKDDVKYDFEAVNVAAQLMKLGRNDEAFKLLNEEIAASPEYSRAWSNRAVIRYWRGDTHGAGTDAETALRLDPTNSQAQDLLVGLSRFRALAPSR